MNAAHIFMAAPLFSAGLTLSMLGAYRKVLTQPIHLYWAFFALGIFCFGLLQAQAAGLQLGMLGTVIAIIGLPSCGMSWLLSRALFRGPDAAMLWPIGVVAALYAAGAVLVGAGQIGLDDEGAILGMVGTIHSLTSSTVLLLALIEPIEGFRRGLPRAERIYRLAFIFGYAALVAVAVIWERQAVASSGDGSQALSIVKVACSIIALCMATLAVIYRSQHPLPAMTAGTKQARRIERQATDADRQIAQRLTDLMAGQDLHTDASLKVSDIAARLGEPEYRISRAITGATGFASFNRLVNSYRIDHAKRLLSDPACAEWSVLSIAMECGFGSIGPFNRAFKDAEGMTPGAWREDHFAGGISVARDASR
ncbi:helix-turn-helix transcriptional regulator [Parvularcula flava]|uniref:AraC family transcriptional regulator n=1 Tax=Aquisalinus luteolus TaxID=1566827 RepID=A0A8J3A4X7_9PROT|nr:AraC family transcriptional regulator [Aquisalinus luteolus]NHK26508.1 helix-turn-helix transcriptional regulator [Aquisalinus luteolus]GGH92550.1 AraC family transcriptional regulator [Aquisalinus luteolus]